MAKNETKATYPVLSPLNLDGEGYAEGDTVELTESQAAELIQAKVIGEAAPAAAQAPSQLNVAQTVELVQAAATVEELDKLAEGETRKGVLDAITKRRAELAG